MESEVKTLQKFAARTPKIYPRFKLDQIFVEKNRAFATDSYIGFEFTSKEEKVPRGLDAKTLEPREYVAEDTPPFNDVFPKRPTPNAVQINASYLLKIARALNAHVKKDGLREITIEVFSRVEPVVFSGVTKDGTMMRGVIMPIRM